MDFPCQSAASFTEFGQAFEWSESPSLDPFSTHKHGIQQAWQYLSRWLCGRAKCYSEFLFLQWEDSFAEDLCWLDGGVEKRVCIPSVLPPLLDLSPSATQLYYARTNHSMLHTVRSFERLIANTAEEVILLQETDSATANDRLYHFKLEWFDDHDNSLRECMPCLNHQVAGLTCCLLITDSSWYFRN